MRKQAGKRALHTMLFPAFKRVAYGAYDDCDLPDSIPLTRWVGTPTYPLPLRTIAFRETSYASYASYATRYLRGFKQAGTIVCTSYASYAALACCAVRALVAWAATSQPVRKKARGVD